MSLEVSWAGYTHFGDDFFVHLWGKEGGGEMNIARYGTKDTLSFFGEMDGARTVSRPETDAPTSLNINAEFVRAITTGSAVSPTVEEGIHMLKIIEAIYRSAAEQREVTLS
jgi:predicted dehydrogenase